MRYNTGNPVEPDGSSSPFDLHDNAGNLDLHVNGTAPTWPDRKGVERKSLNGMEVDFEAAQADKNERFQQFLLSSGYVLIGEYETGLLINERNQIFLKDGEFYRASAALALPYTTTGVWANESGKFVALGDAVLRQELAGPNGGSKVGFAQNGPGAPIRTMQDKMRESLPTLEDFGGAGDYATDNAPALAKLIASGAMGMRLNRGMYRLPDGTTFPTGFSIDGVGAPTLGFGTMDDKQWLRPGYKHLMPGSSLIFSGSGTKSYAAPQRVDEFATMRPCVRLASLGSGSVGTKWRGFAIIQDMNCFDASGIPTKPGQENASSYEVGLLLDDVARTDCNDVVVFGYFPKAGAVISSVLGNDDPDYNTFTGGSLMGKHGLAELGSNNGPASHGLSGTRLFGTGLHTLDHHARGHLTTAEQTAYYAAANTWSCWYIDGDVIASSAEINGHYAYGVEMRTRANHPLRLGYASNVQFYGGVCEISPYGIPNSDTPAFIGSVNVKRGVGFYGLRNNYLSTIFNSNFVGLIPVPVIVSGDPLNGRLGVFGKNPDGGYTGSILGSDGGVGDAALQLTDDANNGNSGWRVSMDVSQGSPLQFKLNGIIKTSLNEQGTLNIAAPAGSDATALFTSNGGGTIWAVRPQYGSLGQLQFREGGSGGPVSFEVLPGGTVRAGTTGIASVAGPESRYKDCYLVNAPNVSSDRKLKDCIEEVPEAWLAAVKKIRIVRYKLKSAIAQKGEKARWHIGVIAQEVLEAFASEGVDAFEIGIVGRDTWEDQYDDVLEEIIGSDGVPTGDFRPTGHKMLTRASGDELSVRYEELHSLIAAARVAG